MKTIEVRNFCLMNPIYRENAPDWANPELPADADPAGTTIITLPNNVKYRNVYDEYNIFWWAPNIPTYRDHLYSNFHYEIYQDGEEIGFAVPVDGIIEGIGFNPEKR